MSGISKEELKRYQQQIKLLAATEGYCTDLPVELIAVRKNVRAELALDEGFLESLRQYGVLQPVVVSVVSDDKKHPMVVLIAGHRRLAGAKAVGIPVIKCISRRFEGDAALTAAVSENVNRTPLHALDLADFFQELELQGKLRRADLEALFDRDRRTIGRYIKMAEWTQHSKELIRQHPEHFGAGFLLSLASRRLTAREVETLIDRMINIPPQPRARRRPSGRSLMAAIDRYCANKGLGEREREIITDAFRDLRFLHDA